MCDSSLCVVLAVIFIRECLEQDKCQAFSNVWAKKNGIFSYRPMQPFPVWARDPPPPPQTPNPCISKASDGDDDALPRVGYKIPLSPYPLVNPTPHVVASSRL